MLCVSDPSSLLFPPRDGNLMRERQGPLKVKIQSILGDILSLADASKEMLPGKQYQVKKMMKNHQNDLGRIEFPRNL